MLRYVRSQHDMVRLRRSLRAWRIPPPPGWDGSCQGGKLELAEAALPGGRASCSCSMRFVHRRLGKCCHRFAWALGCRRILTGNLRSGTLFTRTLARATPGPGAAEIDAVARAAEVAVAAVQDDGPGGRVVGHRRTLPGGRVGRGGLLGPGRAIPGPGVTEIAFKDAAAEQDDVPGGRVVGHRRKFSGGRAGRGRLLGP